MEEKGKRKEALVLSLGGAGWLKLITFCYCNCKTDNGAAAPAEDRS